MSAVGNCYLSVSPWASHFCSLDCRVETLKDLKSPFLALNFQVSITLLKKFIQIDPQQHSFFHLKLSSASTSLGYSGSLRWTTWSSRSTIFLVEVIIVL